MSCLGIDSDCFRIRVSTASATWILSQQLRCGKLSRNAAHVDPPRPPLVERGIRLSRDEYRHSAAACNPPRLPIVLRTDFHPSAPHPYRHSHPYTHMSATAVLGQSVNEEEQENLRINRQDLTARNTIDQRDQNVGAEERPREADQRLNLLCMVSSIQEMS